jgi:hypothetical protein
MQDRIRFVRQIDAMVGVEASAEPVWDLFPNAEALQEEMMDVIRADVKEWQQRRAAAQASGRRARRRR